MTLIEIPAAEADRDKGSWRPPGVDARDLVPDLGREAIQAIKDQVEGARPSTVLGVLLDRRRPIELFTVAGLTATAMAQVEWTVEVLEEEGFCRTFEDDGIQMIELARGWAPGQL